MAQRRNEPHISGRVQPLLSAHFSRMVDALAEVLTCLRHERVFEEDNAVFFELVQ